LAVDAAYLLHSRKLFSRVLGTTCALYSLLMGESL
jgi:hypothetical protein